MARFQLTCLSLALLSISASGVSTANTSHPSSGQPQLYLPEYTPYLFKGDQTRLSWHLMNEARHVLVTGGMIAAGYVLHRFSSGIPLYPLMTATHIAMDWTLSPSVKDFAIRQLVRAPLVACRWYTGSGLYPWVDTLMQESPTLLMGAWEMWLQSQNSLPEGTQDIHFGSGNEPLHIQFSNVGTPQFTLQFNNPGRGGCRTLPPVTHESPYIDHLTQLSCSAHQNAISTLEIKPEFNHSTSDTLIHIKGIKRSGEALPKSITVIPGRHSQNHSTPWITEVLAKSPNKNSVGKALSPLTEKALATLSKAINESPDHPPLTLREDDLTVNVVGGKSMLVAGLSNQSYLLADHTDTQVLSLPTLWLGTGSLASEHLATAALQNLEERRIPGPELGAWRLLTAARSIAHHTLFEKAFNWLSEKRPAVSRFTTNNYTLVKTTDDLNSDDSADILQIVKDAKGTKTVLIGRPGSGKSYLANHLLGKDTFTVTKSKEFDSEIQIFTKNGHQIIELAPFSNTDKPASLLDEIKHQIILAADGATYVIPGNHILPADINAFKMLQQFFPSGDDAVKKLTVTINNKANVSQEKLRVFTGEMVHLTHPGEPETAAANPYIIRWFTPGKAKNTSQYLSLLQGVFRDSTSPDVLEDMHKGLLKQFDTALKEYSLSYRGTELSEDQDRINRLSEWSKCLTIASEEFKSFLKDNPQKQTELKSAVISATGSKPAMKLDDHFKPLIDKAEKLYQ